MKTIFGPGIGTLMILTQNKIFNWDKWRFVMSFCSSYCERWHTEPFHFGTTKIFCTWIGRRKISWLGLLLASQLDSWCFCLGVIFVCFVLGLSLFELEYYECQHFSVSLSFIEITRVPLAGSCVTLLPLLYTWTTFWM